MGEMKVKQEALEEGRDLHRGVSLLQDVGEGEKGANIVEYSLLAMLIAAVCVLSVSLLGQELSESFSRVGSGFAQSQ